ncbi:MAG: hypothetical protein EBY18_24485, partial [Alphaproteobacteria bacterium]|nr:hypothetical protein [Alphaproteobacteria bacterium]
QYAFESLRWFDHWLKGNDTGVMDGPDVRLFVTGGDGSWKAAADWPLPETVWHPFYLHSGGLLSEHEHWPHEGGSSFEDNVYNARGGLSFATPPLVERTEVIGPLTATIHASTNRPELLLFLSLWDIDPEGGQRLLSRGWLKGSMRRTNPETSRPWLWQYDFTAPEPVDTTRPQRYDINIMPTANVFQKGHRIGLRISSSDQDPAVTVFDMLGQGHLLQQAPSWVTIHHDAEHPSVLNVPVTAGNVIGTFISGGSGGMTMAPKVVEACREAGLFWLLVPRELGGSDASTVEFMTMVEELASSDGATAWSLMANSAATMVASVYSSDAHVARMFGGGRLPIMSSTYAPTGRVTFDGKVYHG